MDPGTGGRAQAAAAIWSWRKSEAEEAAPEGGRLRGAIQALVGITIGALLFFFVSRVIGAVVMTIGALILLAALISPNGLYRTIEAAFATLGQWVGRALSWLLLGAIFWLFFFPFSLLFRRGRRDSMRRFYEPEAESYWTTREVGRSASASRERQY